MKPAMPPEYHIGIPYHAAMRYFAAEHMDRDFDDMEMRYTQWLISLESHELPKTPAS